MSQPTIALNWEWRIPNGLFGEDVFIHRPTGLGMKVLSKNTRMCSIFVNGHYGR